MFTAISLMLVGIIAGFLLRRVSWLACLPRAITPTILLMLFVLGIAVGANDTLMSNLPTLGGRALALTLAGVAGSMVCVLAIRRFFPGAQAGRHARQDAPRDNEALHTAFRAAPRPGSDREEQA